VRPFMPDLFVQPLRGVLERLPVHAGETLEEIRIRESRPLEIGYAGRHSFVRADGALTRDYKTAYRPGKDECRALLERLTNHSLYAMEEELRRGYVTVAGGHRVGLAGRVVLDGGEVARLRDIAGFNVRIARSRIGCAAGVMPDILDHRDGTIKHTLIVSPPQQGKTTLLRDIVRCVSSGEWHHAAAAGWDGRKVGVVDERSEIAACEAGVPTFDLGPRCDVLDACPKAEGIMMMVRSLSPEVIAVDEIGRPEDASALHEALHAGVRVVATAHASGPEDLRRRPVLASLAEAGVFGAFVFLSRVGSRVEHRVFTQEEVIRGIKARAKPAIRSPDRAADGGWEP
jgi:stage III sporulation protein AA